MNSGACLMDEVPIEQLQTSSSQWTTVSSISPWLTDATRRLRDVAALPDDWDSYGSPRPSTDAVSLAVRLLVQLEPRKPPIPRIVPVGGGGVQLEWDGPKRSLELEILPNGIIEFLLSGEEGQMEGDRLAAKQIDRVWDLLKWAIYP